VRILAIGDVTSPGGVAHLEKNLWRVRRENKVDLCIVNAENASVVYSYTPEQAERLLLAGADVLSGGNHTLRQRASYGILEENEALLRPINFGDGAPGRGYTIVNARGYNVMVICAMGNVHIDPVLDAPFSFIERALSHEEGRYDLAVLDIHAEATGEKLAVAFAFDGKISAVFGTHTHVPTADLRILPSGTGYVSDLGMCGESGGILGMDVECVITKMKTRLPNKFKPASGNVVANAALFTLDERSGRVTNVERISF
jgi:metallophosphoesterase (TIGR00282 family)